MGKILNDKYYTPIDLARYCIEKTVEVIGKENITEVIEPSVGNGSFIQEDLLNVDYGYDILPQNEAENIIQADFLKDVELEYKKGRLFIGNPPFGHGNLLSIRFYKKCCVLGDYISFIQPISMLNNTTKMYEFDLIYSEDLGVKRYTDRDLHCCLNIYKRPGSGELNLPKRIKLKDVKVLEYRRGSSNVEKIKSGYDYGFCTWGNGSLGKQTEFVGQYAQELYLYINPKFKEQVIEVLECGKIKEYVKSISMKRLTIQNFYKYILKNVEGIE